MITIIKTQNNPHQKQKKIQTLTKSNTNHYIHHSKNTKKNQKGNKKEQQKYLQRCYDWSNQKQHVQG
jgi:hypothetical protein